MLLSLRLSSILLLALFLIVFLEVINIRLGQVLFILLVALILMLYRIKISILLLGAFVLMLSMIVNIVQTQSNLAGILLFATLIAAYFFNQYCQKNKSSAIKILIFVWTFVIFYLLAFNTTSNSIDSAIDGSHNHLNTLLLPFFIISSHLFIRYRRELNYSRAINHTNPLYILYIILSFISFYISIFYTGRTGVLLGVMGIFFIFFNLLNFKSIKSLVSLFCLLFLYFYFINDVFIFLLENSQGIEKLGRENFSEDIRAVVLNHWISLLPDIGNWFGLPTNYFLDKFGIGAHNSAIQIFQLFGMLGLVFFTFIAIYTMCTMISYGGYMEVFLFLILLARMSSDTVFNSIGILIAFWYLFLATNDNAVKKNVPLKHSIFYNKGRL